MIFYALQSISHGTIPYLGTFLTDLTMIDTAIPDMVADGLINFDKRRKEFEVLAQVSYFVRMWVFSCRGLECRNKDCTVLLQNFSRRDRDFIMTVPALMLM